MNTEERLAEVRRRMITDFYKSAAPGSAQWWSCQVCGWVWRENEAELHEPSCPLKGEEV